MAQTGRVDVGALVWGGGWGLYPLRAVPMVGRSRERDLLWAALRSVRERETPTAVILRGAAGNGKSRLAEWLVQRAAEVGAATELTATHGPTPGPIDGLGR